MKKLSKEAKNNLYTVGGFVLLVISAFLVVYALTCMNFQPSGNDIWSHLYKGDIVYHNLQEGRFYQFYSEYWYNGTQLFRYWAPFSYYSVALMEFLSGGDIVVAYRYFAAFSIILGGIPWILWGRDSKRPVFATGIALLWFFLPENLRVYFCEGNMPRMMSAIVIPYVMYFLWRYLRQNKKYSLIGVMIGTSCMLLSHVMITAMLGVATFVFLLIDSRKNKDYRKAIMTMAAMGIGLLLVGIWLMPALSGGILGMDTGSSASVDVMALWSAGLTTLLNPMNRISGVTDTFYYGISVLFLAVSGILLAGKKYRAGFWVFVLILFMSTPAFLPILSKLPMSTLFWMSRFATIVYGFFLFSLLEWTTLKKKYCAIALIILAIDCIPSLNFARYDTSTGAQTKENVEVLKENTTYRAAVMDLSSLGSYPSWGLSTGENAVMSTFGWAWQGAVTSSNIVMLNTAFEYETYEYLFDRCVELGNDTVMIKKDIIGKRERTKQDVFAGAKKSGYYLKVETKEMYIFKKDTPKQFGVKSEYAGLALGRYANIMTMYYPAFCEGDSEYVDDYTLEELKKYRTIFMSGIFYHDKENAEQLLKDAAAAGVKIVIDVTHVQEDSSTKQLNFLGVTSQSITIQNRYPTLDYHGKDIITKDFPKDYSEWFTGYIGKVDRVLGTADYNGQELVWLGTNEENPSIYFLGLNLMYHALETEDMAVFEVMDEVLGIDRTELPTRELVPIQLRVGWNEIDIVSEEENVNTTLAYQDNFESETDIWQENNLLFVKEKSTKIKVKYPRKELGIATSLFGVLAGIILMLMEIKMNRKEIQTNSD